MAYFLLMQEVYYTIINLVPGVEDALGLFEYIGWIQFVGHVDQFLRFDVVPGARPQTVHSI